MILVFSALLEYAFVNSLTRMELERRKKKQRQQAALAAQVWPIKNNAFNFNPKMDVQKKSTHKHLKLPVVHADPSYPF